MIEGFEMNTTGAEMTDANGVHSLRQNYWTIFSAAFAGSIGTALAGLIISGGTVNAIVSLFRSNELPKNAIIFVTSKTCEGLGQLWEPLDPNISAGHFIVGAGGDFIAGQARSGVDKITVGSDNLPTLTAPLPFKLGTITGPDFTHGGVTFVTGLGSEKVERVPNALLRAERPSPSLRLPHDSAQRRC
jgi:hypothetical protein